MDIIPPIRRGGDLVDLRRQARQNWWLAARLDVEVGDGDFGDQA
jgi:hypothetical protein